MRNVTSMASNPPRRCLGLSDPIFLADGEDRNHQHEFMVARTCAWPTCSWGAPELRTPPSKNLKKQTGTAPHEAWPRAFRRRFSRRHVSSRLALRLADQDLLEAVSGALDRFRRQLSRIIDHDAERNVLAGFKRFSGKGIPARCDGFSPTWTCLPWVWGYGEPSIPIQVTTDRAAVLANSLIHNWGVTSTLDQLPGRPGLVDQRDQSGNRQELILEEGDGRLAVRPALQPALSVGGAAAASAGVPYAIRPSNSICPGRFVQDRYLDATSP